MEVVEPIESSKAQVFDCSLGVAKCLPYEVVFGFCSADEQSYFRILVMRELIVVVNNPVLEEYAPVLSDTVHLEQIAESFIRFAAFLGADVVFRSQIVRPVPDSSPGDNLPAKLSDFRSIR